MLALVVLLVVLGGFVMTHAGSRGRALCAEDGFSTTPSLSWWPPGARCFGGEPESEHVRFDATFLLLVPTALLIVLGLELAIGAVRDRRREPPSGTG
jgi:hypothetical protein